VYSPVEGVRAQIGAALRPSVELAPSVAQRQPTRANLRPGKAEAWSLERGRRATMAARLRAEALLQVAAQPKLARRAR
jgi:hypothetical protein